MSKIKMTKYRIIIGLVFLSVLISIFVFLNVDNIVNLFIDKIFLGYIGVTASVVLICIIVYKKSYPLLRVAIIFFPGLSLLFASLGILSSHYAPQDKYLLDLCVIAAVGFFLIQLILLPFALYQGKKHSGKKE